MLWISNIYIYIYACDAPSTARYRHMQLVVTYGSYPYSFTTLVIYSTRARDTTTSSHAQFAALHTAGSLHCFFYYAEVIATILFFGYSTCTHA